MKKNLLSICLVCFLTSQVCAQVTEQWATLYDGLGNTRDQATAMTIDASGNVYVTGETKDASGDMNYGTVKYNSAGVQLWTAFYGGSSNSTDSPKAIVVDGSGNVTVTGASINSGGYDYATVQYNSSGVQQWATVYGSVNSDLATSMAIDASGNIYVTGQAYISGSTDYATIKYNNLGVQQWIASYNGGNTDIARKIVVDASGNVYVTGESYSVAANDNYVTVKYNATGTQLWASSFNGTGNNEDVPNDIALDGSGNVYVTGYTYNGSNNDYATIKYSSAGVFQWSRIYNGTGNNYDQATAIAVDASGNVHVTGYSYNASFNNDYVTLKYSTLGVLAWTRIINGASNGNDVANNITLDATGNVYVTGSSNTAAFNGDYGTVKYNSAGVQQWFSIYNGAGNGTDEARVVIVDGSGNVYVTGYAPGVNNNMDYATLKYNSAGVQQWAAFFNDIGSNSDVTTGMVADANGNIYVTGLSGPGSGTNDFATVKYTTGGVQVWAVNYNGPGNFVDESKAIAVDNAGNVYVTGRTINAAGSNDMATVKYNSSGVQQWATIFNGATNGSDIPAAISVDASGNVYVAGNSTGSTGVDYAIIQYNSSGVQQWAALYNGTGTNDDNLSAMKIDATGNVYVTGESRGVTNTNYVTVKYSVTGSLTWVATYDGLSYDNPRALDIDASGNVYVTGNSYNGTNNDFATVKYNSAGVQQWVSVFNGATNGFEDAKAIKADAQGNVYITGTTRNAANDDYATIKYSAAGLTLWTAFFNGSANLYDQPLALSLDPCGNVYVSGTSGNATDSDIATVSYSSSGIQRWLAIYSSVGSSYDTGLAMALDGSNNVYVAGMIQNIPTAHDFITIKYSQVISITATQSQSDLTCNASCDGTASVVLECGGTAPFTYAWLPSGGTGPTASSLCAGNYSCTITDNLGETLTKTFLITQPPAISITSSQSDVLCNGDLTGSATVVATGGAGGFTYLWTPSGGTAANATGLSAGTYTCTITDSDNCPVTQSVIITQPAIFVAASSSSAVLCSGGNSTVVVSGSGGTSPYAGTGTFTVTAGTYSYPVTDANGCASTTSITVTEPTLLTSGSSATSIACNGGNATVTVTGSGGSSPYSGTGTFTVTAGTYSYPVTDANGCTSTTSITVTEPTLLTSNSSATSILCNGGNATVTVTGSGGTSPYTGDGTFTVTAGTYSYPVTDANGCASTTSITVTEPTLLTSGSSATSIACNGGNATVTVTGSGGTSPYTGAGTFTVTAGTYSYTITDVNGCSNTTSVTVTEPSILSSASTATSILCNGGNATVTVTGSGGTSPYAGEGTFTETAGTYSYTVTDVNGCTSVTTVVITEPTALTSSSSATTILCNGGFATVTVAASGGTSPYMGGGTFTEPAGSYSYTITDNNGCTSITSIVISEPAVLSASVSNAVNPTTCGGTNGSIDIDVTGGTTSYSFLWSNSDINEDLTAVAAGSYSVTITDGNGCITTTSATINDPGAPAVTLTLPIDTACGDFPGIINLSGESPAGGTFSGAAVSGNTFDPFSAGPGLHYITYTFTDINGCSGSTTDSIFVNSCIGIQTIATTQWNLFPNPTNGAISITTTADLNSDVIVEIYSVDGKLIRNENKQQSKTISLDISAEPVGVFIIRITANDKVSMHRVVKI